VAEEQSKPAKKSRKKPVAASSAAELLGAAPQANPAILPAAAPTAEPTAPVAKGRTKRAVRQQPDVTAPAGGDAAAASTVTATDKKPKRPRAPRLKAPGILDTV
jgi:hypothetical protein